MEIEFSKKDFWLAVLAGEIVAWLSLPTLKNLKILDLLAARGINFISFVVFWAIFIPLGAVLGLGAFYFLAKYKNRVGFFQLGKYGVTGVLNTLLYSGIYNFLIFFTDISLGIYVDIFAAIAFVITVTNSFFWNKYWAFVAPLNGANFAPSGREEIKNTTFEAIKFFVVSSIVAIINISIIHITVNVIGAPSGFDPKIWANVALVFAIIVAFLGNFFGYKYIVFKK